MSHEQLRGTLARLAPGTALRDGLERILRGRTGGLIVLGYDPAVEALCDGGFHLDIEFSATRLRELSKMDGAVVLSTDATRIMRANVHLVPDASTPTEESGTRHRTAERTAIQTGYPVVSVSQSMSIISVYTQGHRHVLIGSPEILSRANQALATLERYTARLAEVAQALSALEIEDYVTLRDAMTVVQRMEMVRRIADEIEGDVVELGKDGRLIELQLDELVGSSREASGGRARDGIDLDRELIVQEYLPTSGAMPTSEQVEAALHELDGTELLDLTAIAGAFGYPDKPEALDEHLSPRLPAAREGAAPADGGAAAAGGALRLAAAAARGDGGRAARGGFDRRGEGERDPGGPLPPGGILHSGPLRLTNARHGDSQFCLKLGTPSHLGTLAGL